MTKVSQSQAMNILEPISFYSKDQCMQHYCIIASCFTKENCSMPLCASISMQTHLSLGPYKESIIIELLQLDAPSALQAAQSSYTPDNTNFKYCSA